MKLSAVDAQYLSHAGETKANPKFGQVGESETIFCANFAIYWRKGQEHYNPLEDMSRVAESVSVR